MIMTRGILFAGLLFLAGCSGNNVQPAKSLLPHKMVRNEMTYEIFYNDQHQVIKVETTAAYPGGTMIQATYFTYTSDGQLTELNTTDGWQFNYTYTDGRITSTEELINGILTQTHSFTYDNNGRLAETITFQDIPEEGGVVPVSKDTFAYDGRGNLTRQQRFYYTKQGTEEHLLSSQDFSEYDNKLNSEAYFLTLPINPTAKLFQNNPGKLEVRNGNGVLAFTDTHSYTFNELGYATTKSTHSVGNGVDETYSTTYTFLEK